MTSFRATPRYVFLAGINQSAFPVYEAGTSCTGKHCVFRNKPYISGTSSLLGWWWSRWIFWTHPLALLQMLSVSRPMTWMRWIGRSDREFPCSTCHKVTTWLVYDSMIKEYQPEYLRQTELLSPTEESHCTGASYRPLELRRKPSHHLPSSNTWIPRLFVEPGSSKQQIAKWLSARALRSV